MKRRITLTVDTEQFEAEYCTAVIHKTLCTLVALFLGLPWSPADREALGIEVESVETIDMGSA